MNLIKQSKKMVPLIGLTALFSVSAAKADFIGKVVRISDGDTVTVLNSSNQQIRIRFSQIDAPESKQAFGQKSRQNINFIHEKLVYVKEDSQDRYGRTLGTIYLVTNGQKPNLDITNSINYKQVKDGYAWAYREYLKDKIILSAESEARASKRGLWVDPNPIYPSKFRHN